MREPPGSDRPGAEQQRQELAISSGIIGSSRSGTVEDIRIGVVEAVEVGVVGHKLWSCIAFCWRAGDKKKMATSKRLQTTYFVPFLEFNPLWLF